MLCPIKLGNEAEVLVAWTTGAMTPAEQEAFEQHMAECSACREAAGVQKAVCSALDAWKAPDVSADFDARLRTRIAAHDRLPWWRRLEFSWKPAIPVGVACAALAGAFLLHIPATQHAMPGATSPAIQSQQDAQRMDVDEVERALDDMDMLKQLDGPAPAPARAPEGS